MSIKEIISPQGMAAPFAPYSPAVKAGNMIFTHGVMPLDEEGNVVGVGNVSRQTEQVIDNLRTLLAVGGADLDSIVMMQVFLTDFRNYEAMNRAYARQFPHNPPARYTIGCQLCKPELLVEMAAIAVVGG
jgi:reactive intermediate/imine deaminase